MSEQTYCAHIAVVNRPIEYPGGTKSDYWRCSDCGLQFVPINYDQRRARLRDDFTMAALTGFLSGIEMMGRGSVPDNFRAMIIKGSWDAAEDMLAERDRREAKPSHATT